MDILNEYYPLYPENPNGAANESEESENDEHVRRIDNLNNSKRRKKILSSDDFGLKYNDDMWYIWCIIHDYSLESNLLDRLDFATFCKICYENSTKY
jgi:hypothetical protein